LCSSWQDFNWLKASRGPSATAELLVVVKEEYQKYNIVNHFHETSSVQVCLDLDTQREISFGFSQGKLLKFTIKDCATCVILNEWWEFLATANVNSRSRSLYAIAGPSVVCLSSVTLVHPTQPVEIFRNGSSLFGTLTTRWHSRKILRILSQGNPSGGRVKRKRGSRL